MNLQKEKETDDPVAKRMMDMVNQEATEVVTKDGSSFTVEQLETFFWKTFVKLKDCNKKKIITEV